MHLKKWISFVSVNIAAYASMDFSFIAIDGNNISLDDLTSGTGVRTTFTIFKLDGFADETVTCRIFGAMGTKFVAKRWVPIDFAEDVGGLLTGNNVTCSDVAGWITWAFANDCGIMFNFFNIIAWLDFLRIVGIPLFFGEISTAFLMSFTCENNVITK